VKKSAAGFLVFSILMWLAPISSAVESQINASEKAPLDSLLSKAKEARNMCKLKYDTYWKKLELGMVSISTREPCISGADDGVKLAFQELLESVKGNGGVENLVKDYYAYWITGMEAIVPSQGESVSSYNRRQADIDDRLSGLGNRLRVELQAYPNAEQTQTSAAQVAFSIPGRDTLVGAFFIDIEQSGITVSDVYPNSPAWRAGLRTGDIVRAVNRSAIRSAEEFREAIRSGGRQAAFSISRATENVFLIIQ